ncbi:MAG: shikimate kinase [Lachnospiraceae bacterium]|nr:shikimate kinase [Lachnospiraceae bacterium]
MNDRNNICLIGYMGSGKSTVGRLVAKRLKMCFTDTDALIVDRESRSIPDIFEKEGEAYFRKLEASLAKELAEDESFRDAVVSTGGGIVLAADNRKNLRRMGTVVYLRAEPDTLYERVRNDTGRPLLNTEDVRGRIRDMLKTRSLLYEDAADHIIDTDELDAQGTANAVIDIVYMRHDR